MIYFFNSRGECIQKWDAHGGDAITLQPLIRRHYLDMKDLGCSYHAWSPLDAPMEDWCWYQGRMQPRLNPHATLEVNESTRTLTLTKLPIGGDLLINGTRYPITDDSVQITLTYGGTVSLRVQAVPYRDAHFDFQVP
jgi:hypothetical protein